MIRIQTPSRLHFGLLSLPREDASGLSVRRFGGVGLMIDSPGILLTIERSSSWVANGYLAERAMSLARQFTTTPETAYRITVERSPCEHTGLGVGTQLGLAVAKAIATDLGLQHLTTVELAKMVGRGQRSAIGVHGFERGGFLVEEGKSDLDAISALVASPKYPNEWPIVLVTPRHEGQWHGEREKLAFARLFQRGMPAEWTSRLWEIVRSRMFVGLENRDVTTFGEAVYDYNRMSGEAFAEAQGGIYASKEIAFVVAVLRELGLHGVGQSSWGPTVFAIAESIEQAQWLMHRLREQFPESTHEIMMTTVSNGAIIRSV